MRLLHKRPKPKRVLMRGSPAVLDFYRYPLLTYRENIIDLWFGLPGREVRDIQILD